MHSASPLPTTSNFTVITKQTLARDAQLQVEVQPQMIPYLTSGMAADLISGTASQSDAMDPNPYLEWNEAELIAGIEDVQTHIAKAKKELQAVSIYQP